MKKSINSSEKGERMLHILKEAIVITTDASLMDEEYLKNVREGGITTVIRSVTSPQDTNFRTSMNRLCELYQKLTENCNELLLATTVKDIKKAKEEEKTAIVFYSENPHVEGDLDLLRIFHRLGIRILQLTHNKRNLIGDGCLSKADCGLSDFGIQVVEEMNKLGMVIDISHCGNATRMDAVKFSKDPVVATHANARALCDHVRNLSDEQIKALAEKGGVVGVTAFPPFIGDNPKPVIDDLLNHIDHIARLVGVKHVGIGLDLVKGRSDVAIPANIAFPVNSVSEFPKITKGLISRGYSDEQIKKIIGENFLRVFRRVWDEGKG